MNNIFHSITTWSSSLIILIMGGLLITVGLPKASHWKQLRYGCFSLAASYFILGMAGLVESIAETSGKLINFKSQLVLAVAFYQAMLFTDTSLAFIQLEKLPTRPITVIFSSITLLIVGFTLTYFFILPVYPYMFGITIAVYISLLLYYTILFNNAYNRASQYYDINNPELYTTHLHRVSRLFYVSLSVGIIALVYVLMPERKRFTEAFTICYTIYYVYLVFSFISFLPYTRRIHLVSNTLVIEDEKETLTDTLQRSNEMVGSAPSEKNLIVGSKTPATEEISITEATDIKTNTPADSQQTEANESHPDPTPTTPTEKHITKAEKRLAEALDRWVENERYLSPDVPIEEIAIELDTDVYSLHDYFLSHKGILFRTWRVMLRIEKAKQLLETNPKIRITELQHKVGFSDKSYFFRRFKQVTGKTPNEYRNDLLKHN